MIIITVPILFWSTKTTLTMHKTLTEFSTKIRSPGNLIFAPGNPYGKPYFLNPISPSQTHRGRHSFIWGEVYDHNHRPDTFLEHSNNSNDAQNADGIYTKLRNPGFLIRIPGILIRIPGIINFQVRFHCHKHNRDVTVLS